MAHRIQPIIAHSCPLILDHPMRFSVFFFLILVSIGLLRPIALEAKEVQKSLGTFGLWQTYSYNENNQQVCYMVKAAHFPSTKQFKRGASYLMITHRPSENSDDVISYNAGYNYKPAADVKVTIGKDSFSLFSQKDTAWSRDTKTDHLIATAISHSDYMKVSGVPAQKGASNITDTLDLKGSHAAYDAISKACGLEQEAPPKGQAPHPKKAK